VCTSICHTPAARAAPAASLVVQAEESAIVSMNSQQQHHRAKIVCKLPEAEPSASSSQALHLFHPLLHFNFIFSSLLHMLLVVMALLKRKSTSLTCSVCFFFFWFFLPPCSFLQENSACQQVKKKFAGPEQGIDDEEQRFSHAVGVIFSFSSLF
jgi:hypothetical protein